MATPRLTKPLLEAMASALHAALVGGGFDGGDFDGKNPEHFKRALATPLRRLEDDMTAPFRQTLLHDDTPRFLCDVPLDEADRIELERIADEFQNGMNSTIEGVRRALRQWTSRRPVTVTERLQSRRLWALRLLDRFAEERGL